jgi:hypothetical protein
MNEWHSEMPKCPFPGFGFERGNSPVDPHRTDSVPQLMLRNVTNCYVRGPIYRILAHPAGGGDAGMGLSTGNYRAGANNCNTKYA